MCNTSLTFFYHLLFDTSLFYYGWKLYYSVPLFQMWYVLFDNAAQLNEENVSRNLKVFIFCNFLLGQWLRIHHGV